MSSQLSYPPMRPNLTGIVAACILSGGLITAAIIDSRKPLTAFSSAAMDSGRRVPPISKESIRAQITSQLLAAPQLRGVNPSISGPATGFWFPASEITKGRLWNLTGVNLTYTGYLADKDMFDLTFDLTWQDDSGTVVHIKDGTTMSNDGYDQYHDEYSLRSVKSVVSGDAPTVNLTIK